MQGQQPPRLDPRRWAENQSILTISSHFGVFFLFFLNDLWDMNRFKCRQYRRPLCNQLPQWGREAGYWFEWVVFCDVGGWGFESSRVGYPRSRGGYVQVRPDSPLNLPLMLFKSLSLYLTFFCFCFGKAIWICAVWCIGAFQHRKADSGRK